MTATPTDAAIPAPTEEEGHRISAQMIWVAIAALVVGLVAGFFIGRGTASSGPSSLADAVTQTVNGSLPRGDVAGALQKSGGFRALLGTGGGLGRGGGTGGGTGAGGGTGPGGGTGAGGGAGRVGGGVAGTVASINGNVITITTNAGPVKVTISGATTYQKSVAATLGDVTAGERVTVRPDFTAPSSGGQVNAGTVIIQPAAATPTSQ
ncbi:MAG TPA: hypothetical protein VLV81_11035 [Acidimicrobiia bacterium]|nr:hypothetical protein [Acidimicrobiia bacterium]